MRALYVHIPFCRRRCAYCHFDIKVFHPRTDPTTFHDRYLQAVTTELQSLAEHHGSEPITSIFLGGGTPSQLPLAHLTTLFEHIRRHYELVDDCEISMEVNPEDVADNYLDRLRNLGVNRLSFGVQSFHDPSLRAIGRIHNAAKAETAIRNAPTFPKGLSFDLILGLPHQTQTTLTRDLDLIQALAPDHVALYLLEQDVPTPLDKQTENLPDDDQQADFYDQTKATLTNLGFEHYEISNFAKPGFQCRHNLTYWRCGDYLGVGPAAHGRIKNRYYRNAPQLNQYTQKVAETNRGKVEEQQWSPERLRQERIVQGLRLSKGIPSAWLTQAERNALEPMIQHNLVHLDDHLALTPNGRLLGNEVFSIFVS